MRAGAGWNQEIPFHACPAEQLADACHLPQYRMQDSDTDREDTAAAQGIEAEEGGEQHEQAELDPPKSSTGQELALPARQGLALAKAPSISHRSASSSGTPAPQAPWDTAAMIEKALTAGRTKYTAVVIHCGVCSASSAVVAWYKENVVNKAGIIVLVPEEELCMICGSAFEAWPLESDTPEKRKAMVARYHGELGFKEQVDLVRMGAKCIQARLFRDKAVESERNSGVSVKLRAALVESTQFKDAFGSVPESVPGVVTATVIGPNDLKITGGIMSLAHITPDIPHYEVEMFATAQRLLRQSFLNPAEVLREEQPAERYSLACKRHAESLAQDQVTPAHFAAAPSPEQVRQAIVAQDKAKADRERLLAEQAEAGASGLAAAAAVPARHGGLDDDDDGGARPRTPARKRKAPAGGPARAAARPRVPRAAAVAAGVAAGEVVMSTDAGNASGQKRVSSSRPLSEESEISSILWSVWAAGRTTRPLREKLQEGKCVDEEDKFCTENMLAAADAATVLAIKGLSKTPWGQALSSAQVLDIQGYSLPPLHKRFLAIKFVVFSFANNKTDDVFHGLNPEVSNWVTQKPTFGSCWDTWGSREAGMQEQPPPQGSHQSPDKKAGKETFAPPNQGHQWLEALFCNGWAKLFQNAPQDTAAFLNFNMMFVQWANRTRPQWPAEFGAYGTVAINVALGFVAALCPWPGYLGSGLQHVNYLYSPGGGKPAVVDDLPYMGRTIVTKIRKNDKENTFWPRLFTQFHQHFSAEKELGPQFMTQHDKAVGFLRILEEGGEVDVDEWDSFLAECKVHMATWKAELREGATNRVQECIDKVSRKDIEQVTLGIQAGAANHEDAVKLLEEIQSLTALLDDPAGKNLSELCSSHQLKFTTEISLSGIRDNLSKLEVAPSDEGIQALSQALAANPAVPADVLQQLQTCIETKLVPWLQAGHGVSYASVVEILKQAKGEHTRPLLEVAEPIAQVEDYLNTPGPYRRVVKAFIAVDESLSRHRVAAPVRGSNCCHAEFLDTAAAAVQTLKQRFIDSVVKKELHSQAAGLAKKTDALGAVAGSPPQESERTHALQLPMVVGPLWSMVSWSRSPTPVRYGKGGGGPGHCCQQCHHPCKDLHP